MVTKLSRMPYAQANVMIEQYGDEKLIRLISYTTCVLEIRNNWLKVNGLYSATTRKHISAFMKEYTNLDYYSAKQCYEDGIEMNIETGEVRKVGE